MDPLSLTVGTLSLVGLAAQTIGVTTSYVREAKHGREAAEELLRELEVLHLNLSRLDAFLGTEENVRSFEDTSVLVSSTSACRNKLTLLHQKLTSAGQSRLSRLKWPLHSKEHQHTIDELRAFSEWIQFALTVDGCALLSKTSAEVLDTLKHQLETFQLVESISAQTHSVRSMLEEQAQHSRDQHAADEREKVLNWISTIKHEQKHHDLRKPRVPGTGDWLLKRDEFLSWRDEPQLRNNVLWCHGIQGSGKSILASLVIDDLRDVFRDENVAIAYYYLDYRDQEAQSAEVVIASLLKQLALVKSQLPQPVSELYHKLRGQRQPQQQDLEQVVLSLWQDFDRMFIVIDALDECGPNIHRKAILRFLEDLRKKSSANIFVTSRPHIEDDKYMQETCSAIEIQADNSDLGKFVSKEIERSDAVDDIDDHFREAIVEKIIRGAQSMFLLPVLQIQTILSETSVGEMEEALEAMPRGLDDAFEETVERIQKQQEKRRVLGLNTLMWIYYAKRPLKVAELSEALAIKPGGTFLDPKFRKSQKIMVSCCLGLVTVDEKSSVIRLVHYSVQEYLRKNHSRLFPSGEQLIAEYSIAYLLSDAFALGSRKKESEIIALIDHHPFARYATRFWGCHVRDARSQTVDTIALKFLRSNSHRACSGQIFYYGIGYREEYWEFQEASSRNGLHISSFFGLEKLAEHLLESGECDVNSATKIGTTALILAASSGQQSIIRMLLTRNADLTTENWFGTALHCAAESGNLIGISELLSTGMIVDIRDSNGRTALHCATAMGHLDAMRLLLERGAHINAVDKKAYTSLRYAVVWEHNWNIVEILLANGADTETRSDSGFTVLHHAANMDLEDVLILLLNHGAMVDAKDTSGSTALHLAAERDNVGIVETLLKRGANVDAQTNEGVTALYLAAECGAETTVEALLKCGAEIDVADEEGLTPFYLAVKERHLKIMTMLLIAGADVNARSKYGGKANNFATGNEINATMRLSFEEWGWSNNKTLVETRCRKTKWAKAGPVD